jgi:protein-tyrosine phosphatase
MIDLHNHILPGLDDGAADLEESVQIARQFLSEGVTVVAATPHLNPERQTGAGPEVLHGKLQELRRALVSARLDLNVVAGNELYLVPDAAELLQAGIASTLGDGHYVLAELSLFARERPLYLEDALFRIQLAGYSVILAHPERYPFVQRDQHAVDSLLDREVVLQLTAPALLGDYGAAVRRTAEGLLRHGAYALAASDRHHPGAKRSLADLHGRIEELTDLTTADLLLKHNPDRVLADARLEMPVPVFQQPSLFDRLLHRG